MRRRIAALAAAIAAAALISVSIAAPDPSDHDDGSRIRVFDGDSIQVAGIVYNLVGVDAPELGQVCIKDGSTEPCGLNAAYNLRKMLELGRTSLKCEPIGEGDARAGKQTVVAECAVGDQDVSLALIQGGQALALPEAPPDYLAAQEKAKQAGLGIWGSRFVEPWKWREGERLAKAEAVEEQQGCVIKAIPQEHRRLYFGPLDDEYEAIDPTTVSGGRTFCSDEEARAAGWRRPQI